METEVPEEMFDPEMPLVPPRYYWAMCATCQCLGQDSAPLKRCSQCQCMFYCSPRCQRADRRAHRPLCKLLAPDGDGEIFFHGHEGSRKLDWTSFLHSYINLCEVLLGRQLSVYERDVIRFPHVCSTPGCYSTGSPAQPLQDCQTCLAASWCSALHREESAAHHATVCQELLLTRVADKYESTVSLGNPPLPSDLDAVYRGTEPDIVSLLKTRHAYLDRVVAQPDRMGWEKLELVFLTNMLSGPCTLLDVGHRSDKTAVQRIM